MPLKSRLLLVTRNLPPLRGGMERLNARMAVELSQTYEVTVLAPRHSQLPHPCVNMLTSPWGSLVGFLLWAFFASIREAFRVRPVWVMGGSGLVAPVVWAIARLSHARLAIYIHGLDIVVDNAFYQKAWLPFIRRVDRVVANSHNTARLAAEAGVPASRITVIHPGTDLTNKPVSDSVVSAFRSANHLGNARILLSVGRLTERKGLVPFIADILPAVVRAFPFTLLVVIGDDAQDALAGGDTSQRSQALLAARRHNVEDNVRLLGAVGEDELLAAYATSDVHVFPVIEVAGDIEGFGMVAIEAAAHGLPTVAYAVGGVVDAVDEGRSGHLVPPGDQAGFISMTCSALAAGRDSFAARDFAAHFAWTSFGSQLCQTLEGEA